MISIIIFFIITDDKFKVFLRKVYINMIKIILLISYVLENIFDFVLVKLNDSYVKKPLPENVIDVYDEEKYNKHIFFKKASFDE